ncbi:MFS general substrate transporter [Hesseltinella vesiculosa]|uniref:MFS general substrate transporter n=1 Tax=Hesseltinella vesiculosa TaxID=101127 RepID=A0A1X2G240_9FUNG|nr:MFS general substrate transporter [Hesseltinella vesiculosa]
MANRDDTEKQVSPEERAFVRRLDKRLLAFAMAGNIVKTLDSTNLGSAFISGMEEELNITGLQYNWMGVLFMIGYLSMQIPSNIILSRYRPSVYLPFLEAIWCLLTLSMACVRSVRAVYIIRYLLGSFEAGFYPGIVFLLGTWYTKRELGKRMALLNLCGALGAGSSGLVQAVMLKTMDGVWNISGWRWMFVFDALLTSLLAFFGYYYLPDYPATTQWLSKAEKDIAIQRTGGSDARDHRKDQGSRWAKLRTLAGNVYLYPFMIGWAALHVALGACHVLGIVAKKLGFDAVTANLLSTPDMLITMLVGVTNGFISDHLQSRIWCLLLPASFGLLGCLMLASFIQPFKYLYVAFILTHAGLGSVTSVVMTWASEIITTNTELRAMAIACMNTFSSMMWTWTPLYLWPVTDAPRYHTGFRGAAVGAIVFLICMTIVYYLYEQNNREDRGKYSRLEGRMNEYEDLEQSIMLTPVANSDALLHQRSPNEKPLD